jgi:hypothetical protein
LFIICVLVPRVSAVVAKFIRRFRGIVIFAKSVLGFAVSRIEIQPTEGHYAAFDKALVSGTISAIGAPATITSCGSSVSNCTKVTRASVPASHELVESSDDVTGDGFHRA